MDRFLHRWHNSFIINIDKRIRMSDKDHPHTTPDIPRPHPQPEIQPEITPDMPELPNETPETIPEERPAETPAPEIPIPPQNS